MFSCHSSSQVKVALVMAALFSPLSAAAGGITVGGTRIIYPVDGKTHSVSITNSSKQSTFLVQSWVEDAKGEKSHDFIVAPPLYTSSPGDENTLNLIYAAAPPAKDRETLYYFNSKAIPSIEKNKIQGKNMLLIATVTRLKIFLRPKGLKPSIDQAEEKLNFSQNNHQLLISNPTPYYLTLCGMKVGADALETAMVPPYDSITLPLNSTVENSITYHTINDFGATTSEHHAIIRHDIASKK
ncbi:fimbria/pilus periplasmic chaperone [Xanthomonas axonopodis]